MSSVKKWRGGADGSGTFQGHGSSLTSPSSITSAMEPDTLAGTFSEEGSRKNPTPERRLSGRGVVFPADKFPAGACVCARPRAIVFCRGCGYYRPGRKRIQCPQHGQVHFLYDVDACEKCHLSCYLDEVTP